MSLTIQNDGYSKLEIGKQCSSTPASIAGQLQIVADTMKSGHRLRGLLLDGLHWPLWNERFVDCYVAHFGADDRRDHSSQFAQLLGRCDIFKELNFILAPYRLRARLDSVEEVSSVDFRKPHRIGQHWVAKYAGHSGKAEIDGIMWIGFVKS